MLCFRNKKGDVSDIITFMIIVFFLAVSFLVVAFANDQLKDAIEESALNDSNTAGNYTAAIDNITTNTVHRGFALIFGFIVIGMMVSSFMVRIHPIFLFMYIIFLAISIFTCIPLANSYEMLMESSAIAEVAAQQTMINWIMQHLVIITLAVGALSMIIAFAKLVGGRGGNEI